MNCLRCKVEGHVVKIKDIDSKLFKIKLLKCLACQAVWKDYTYNEEDFIDESSKLPSHECNTSSDSAG